MWYLFNWFHLIETYCVLFFFFHQAPTLWSQWDIFICVKALLNCIVPVLEAKSTIGSNKTETQYRSWFFCRGGLWKAPRCALSSKGRGGGKRPEWMSARSFPLYDKLPTRALLDNHLCVSICVCVCLPSELAGLQRVGHPLLHNGICWWRIHQNALILYARNKDLFKGRLWEEDTMREEKRG